MKLKLVFALFTLALIPQWRSAIAAPVGQPAPDFVAQDINGQTHRLRDYRGKIVVLESINLDCPYCAHQYTSGAMPALQAESAAKGVVWLLVNSVNPKHPSFRNPAAARKEMAQYKMKAAAWLDDSSGKLGRLFDMQTTPHMFVVNPNGVLVYQGAIDDRPSLEGDPAKARNYVREAIRSLLNGQRPSVAQTKPYGCGIKYAM